MKDFRSFRMTVLATTSLAVLAFSAAAAAYAEQALRIVHFTVAGAQQEQQVFALVDTEINKLYLAAKGFKSVKYFYNAKTLEVGSVSVWDSQADLDAFLKSDGYKPIAGKLKPLIVGEMTSTIYSVRAPKK
jgi:heme-degrading monooxygenase HmoA